MKKSVMVLLLILINNLYAQSIIHTIVQPGLSPTSIVVYEKMDRVFVADTSDKIFVYDGSTMTLIDTISTGIKNIDQMVLVEQYGKLYAARFQISNNVLLVIDANTGSVIKIIYTGGIYSGGFIQLLKDEDLGKVYYLCVGEFCQIDVATDSVNIIPGISGKLTSSLALNPVTHEIFYTPNIYSPPMSVVDAFTLSHFDVDIGGTGIGVNWKENKVYIAYTGGGPSYIYNRNTGSIKYTPTSNDATILVYNPKSNLMYSSSEIDNLITIIDGATDSSFNIEWGPGVPYVSYATGHIFYPGYPMRILDDSTHSYRKIKASLGSIITIDQKLSRVYVGRSDTIRVIQDRNDSWPLSAPKLFSPPNNAIEVPLGTTLIWNKISGATSYEVQVSRYPYFGTNDIDSKNILDTMITITLYLTTDFYWRARAINDSVIGNYSETSKFTTFNLLPPVLSHPNYYDNNVSINPIFTWNRSFGATSYRLQVSEWANFSILLFDSSNITDTSLQIFGLSLNTQYFWRMTASNEYGTSNFGSWVKFTPTLNTAPDKPLLVEPTNNSTNQPTTLTLKWRKTDRATSYHLQLSNSLDFTTLIVNDSTLSDTIKSITNIPDGNKYYWHINAKNLGGVSGFSDFWNFITILMKPDSLKAFNYGPNKVKLTWIDNSMSEHRFIVERKTSTENYSVLDTVSSNTYEYFDTTVIGLTEYKYRIKCFNDFAVSEFSNEAIITTITSLKDNYKPLDYSLQQNYPNPFNPTTTIGFGIMEKRNVRMSVLNILGEEIKVLLNEEKDAGYHSIDFNASDLPSGVYFYQLTVSPSSSLGQVFIDTKKMVLLK